MRSRLLILILVAATASVALVPAAGDGASSVTLKVRACETGNKPRERYATFHGRMRRVPGTRRMMMRFSVVDRSSHVGAPRRVTRWRKSRRGVRSFGYAQRVTGLRPGGRYAAVVRFRWVGARGRTIRTVRRSSRVCRPNGALPNLRVRRIGSMAGDAPHTRHYTITVTNRGRGHARGVSVHLIVDSAAADATEIDSLPSGDTRVVQLAGPVCRARVRGVVDRSDAIPETTEDDNSLRRRCPPVGR